MIRIDFDVTCSEHSWMWPLVCCHAGVKLRFGPHGFRQRLHRSRSAIAHNIDNAGFRCILGLRFCGVEEV